MYPAPRGHEFPANVALQRIVRPVLYVFEALSGVVNRVTGGESDIESYLTREEIATLVLSGEAAGALDAAEQTTDDAA